MNCGRIFVTGTTGILGSHLLTELLKETSAQLLCLVRANSPEEGAERLLKAISHYDPKGELADVFRARVKVIPGDIAKPHFGLEQEQYLAIAESIEGVVHVAALTDLFLSLHRIEPINVGGTRNIIDFTLHTPKKYLCHISTHTVVGDKTFDPTVAFKETDLDVGQGFHYFTYQYSKFVAEKMVREATDKGLVWNIMRPGQIFGDSRNGAYPMAEGSVSGLFYDIFKTAMEARVIFHSDTHFDVVPVDYVSRGIVELGLKADKKFETYHLTNPDVKRYDQVMMVLTELGYPIQVIPQPEYYERLRSKTLAWDRSDYKSATTSAFRWWFKRDIDFKEGGYTDCEFTRAQLATRGIVCPKIDRNLLGTYVEAGQAIGYFSKPPARRTVVRDGWRDSPEVVP